LHLAALAKGSADIPLVAENALRREVGVRSVERFRLCKSGASGLVFGYGALDEQGIVAGLTRLRRVFGR
jgi:DNA-binding transcriptional MocR family regulator